MKRVLITGAHGLLGQKAAICFGRESDAEILLADLGRETFFAPPRYDYMQLDITERADVKSIVSSFRPDIILHTAALTDVDLCESERERTWRVNVDGLKNLIIPARRLDQCHLIFLSTDYVFDGRSSGYSEDSRPNPINYYGKTKLAAENALRLSGVPHAIIRTQLLYGTGIAIRRNFVLWALEMLGRRKSFPVVDDQTGNPTFVDDLAYALFKLAEQRKEGLYHVAGSEALSRHALACRIAGAFGFDETMIRRVRTADLHQAAQRPANSTFVTLKFESEFGFRLSAVDQGLQRLQDQYREGAEFLNHLTRNARNSER